MGAEQQRQAIERLPRAYRDWLVEVEPVITDEERAMFLTLTKDYQRDAFIQRFWEVRNRRPGARANEARERYAERVAAARARYGDLHADARARILLKNGEPDEVTVAACASLLWPLEVWHYSARSADLVADEIYVVFYRRFHAGPFRLWDPGEGIEVLFADRGAGGQGTASLGALILDCREGEVLAKLLGRAMAAHPVLLATFDGKPAPVGREWVATFGAYSTDVPEGAAALAAKLGVSYPGRRESRTVLEGVLEVAAASAVPSRLGGRLAYDFLVTGEVLAGGELFESFRYKFDVPALPPTAAADAAGSTVPLVFQRQLRPGDYTLIVKLEDLNSGRLLRLEQPLAVPRVEEAMAGAGGAKTPAADPAVRSVLEEANTVLAGGAPAIRLVAPIGELQTGMARFDALATGPGIDRVTFALDGKPVFVKRKPPYSVELDLGTAPRTHRLTASALAVSGAMLATDELIVNSAGNRFRIKLVEPQRGKKVRSSLLARAEVETPDGEGGVERVELYLGETLAATLYQPPYEQAMVLPRDQALGYVRAVAYLADGSSTEDVVFVNAPDDLEQVNVQYVELYASLLDHHGRPVAGAAANRFTVLEDGVRQDLVRCERVSDLPIHAAVVLDTSASMESSLETAKGAVLRFLETAIKPRDRAAVITFNDHPFLAVKFTSDQAALAAGLAGLKAERGTALYDTLVYAFYYFNGVKGQRAI
ncbi:MAG TPA: GWxTD domain-containing protein, partial [Thermoanaerobaculia bacterium]|nr:GWxTD domain-containing protein [Thermoanaerobaculia bacterium]